MKDNNMSSTFFAAFNSSDPDEAIRLYTKEIEEINPLNFSAWQNRGLKKVEKGRDRKDVDLVLDGILDIRRAIELAEEKDLHGYPIAYANLEMANDILMKMQGK